MEFIQHNKTQYQSKNHSFQIISQTNHSSKSLKHLTKLWKHKMGTKVSKSGLARSKQNYVKYTPVMTLLKPAVVYYSKGSVPILAGNQVSRYNRRCTVW
jgi:hypothetical protein